MKPNVCSTNCNCHGSSPSVVVVQTTDGIKGLANVFAYVSSINTVFYVSPDHQITIVSSGPVYVDDYDPKLNWLNLKAQTCYDFAQNKAYVFNPKGEYRTINLEEA